VNLNHGGQIEVFAKTHGLAPSQVLDFSTNVNFHFDRQWVRSVLGDCAEAAFSYPDPACRRLRDSLARRHGCSPDNILPANGATELFHLAVRSHRAGRGLIYTPAFSEYEAVCQSEGLETHFVPAREEDRFLFTRTEQIDAVEKWNPDVVFLGNPNNPTGRLADVRWLKKLVETCGRLKALLILDEAFMDFIPDGETRSFVALSGESPHLLVVRSLTKFFSIPGLRIGYALGHSEMIERLADVQPTWSVNGLAQETTINLLDRSEMRSDALDALRQAKERFVQGLEAIEGLEPYPSDVNFILCRLDSRVFEAEKLRNHLAAKGILVRFCSDYRGLEKSLFIRLAVRQEKENTLLINTLNEAVCRVG